MRELTADLERWRGDGRRIAVARVVGVEGSGPRPPGAVMAVTEAGEVAGSVSGGCVEGAVVEVALEVLASGRPRMSTFGYSDEDAFAVGLTCGGTVHVFVSDLSSWDPIYGALRDALAGDEAAALATVITGEDLGSTLLVRPDAPVLGTLGDPGLDRVVARDALGELASGTTTTRHYGPHGEARQDEVSIFVESFAPAPRMLVFGAVDFTAALVRVAKVLGYRVTVCDARPMFATTTRFPLADEVVVDWPDRHLRSVHPPLGPQDAVCVLTHDHKFDVPALVAAVATDAGYIGAMGSRRTHAERVERLREEGLSDKEVARIFGPIGLDLGARTPEETAISICAEIIAQRAGRAAPSLRDAAGPIHRGHAPT